MDSYDVTSKIRLDISEYRDGFREAESVARTSADKMGNATKGFTDKTRGDGNSIKSNFTKGFDGAKAAGERFKSALASIRDRVVSFAIYDIGKNLVRGFKDAIKSGIDYNAMMEVSNTKWKNMLGSQEKATSYQKIINDLAAKTPFEYEGLDKMALKLEMAGLGGKDLEKNMIAVGDAVAAVGGGGEALDGVSNALSKMLMKGKVGAEEMQMLAERGIPSWDLLAKSMGKSKAEVIKLSSEGKLIAKDVMPGLIGQMSTAFGGSMATQAETYNGKLSTLGDTIKIMQGELTKPLFELLKKPMQWLIDNLPSVPARFEAIKDSVAGFLKGINFGGIIEGIKNFAGGVVTFIKDIDFGKIIDNAKNVAKTITDFIGKIDIGKIIQDVKDFATNLSLWATNTAIPEIQKSLEKMKPIFDAAVKIAMDMYKIFQDNWPSIQTNITNVGSALKTAFDGALDIIRPIVDYISKFREENNLTLPILAGVAAAMVTFKVAMGISSVITTVTTALNVLKASTLAQTFVQGGLNAVMAANPIALVVLAIAGLVAVGVLLYKNWDTVKAKALELWNYLTTTWNNIKTAVVETVTGLWTSITTTFTNIKEGIATKVGEIATGLATAFLNIKDGIVTKVTEIADSIATFFTVTIPEKFNEFIGFVAGLPERVATFLKQLFLVDLPYWAGFAVGTVVKFFMELPGKMTEFLTNVVTNITTWATTLKDKAIELGTQFVANVIKFFSELPGKIKTKTSEIVTNIIAWVSNLKTKATNFGTDFINNVMTGIKELPGKIATKTSEIVTSISTWVSDLKTKASDAGKSFLDKVIEFITQLPGKIKERLDEVINRIVSWATRVGVNASNAGKDMLDKFMTGIKELPSKIYNFGKDIVDGLINGVKNWAGNVWDSAKDIASGFLGGFKKAMGIGSPSKEMAAQAGWTVVGFINKVKAEGRNVKKSATTMASKFTNSFNPSLAYSYAGIVDDIVASNSFEATSIIKNDTNGREKPANINIRLGKTRLHEFVRDIEDTADMFNDTVERYGV